MPWVSYKVVLYWVVKVLVSVGLNGLATWSITGSEEFRLLVESTVLEEQVVEQLVQTAQVRDRPVPFLDLLKMDVSIE